MSTEQSIDRYRILHLIPTLDIGGGEQQLLRNLSLMDSTRFENIVCHMYPRTELAGDLKEAGVEVRSIETRGLLKTIRMARKLRRILREERIDLVHTTNAEAGIVGGLASRMAGVPTVTTLNGSAYGSEWLVDNPSLNRLKLRYMKTSRWTALRFLSSHAIAVSNYVKDDFHRSLGVPEDQMDVVPRGINDDFFDPQPDQTEKARAELVPQGSFPVLVNIGRLVPAKGQRYLLEAMPEIIERYPNALLLMVGSGQVEAQLKQTANDLGLGPHVIFTGSRRDVRAILDLADVFVFPSLHEGMPGALLEAMAAGRPCVVSNAGPMPELIEDDVSGLLVEPRSGAEIVEAVIRLTDDSELRNRLGEGAKERAWSHYRLVNSASATASVFEKVILRSRAKKGQATPSEPANGGRANDRSPALDRPDDKA